jgi:hypothetical protein
MAGRPKSLLTYDSNDRARPSSGPLSVSSGPLSVSYGPLSVSSGPSSVSSGPLSVSSEPLSVSSGSLSVSSGPLSVSSGPLSVSFGPLSVSCGQLSVSCGPLSRVTPSPPPLLKRRAIILNSYFPWLALVWPFYFGVICYVKRLPSNAFQQQTDPLLA